MSDFGDGVMKERVPFASYVFLSSLLLVAAFLSACSGFSVTGGPGTTFVPLLKSQIVDKNQLFKVNSILVVPVSYAHDVSKRQGELSWIRHGVAEAFKSEAGLEIVDLTSGEEFMTPELRQDLPELAGKYGADGVLLTFVDSITERSGSRLGADQPAAVSFRLELVGSKEFQSLWKASYVYNDRALSENMLTIDQRFKDKGRKPGWRTARELVMRGVREAALALGEERNKKFLKGGGA